MAGRLRGFVAGVLVASVVGVGGFAVVRATSGSSSASSFVPVSPVRVLDTRSDLGLVAVTDGVAGTLKVTGSIATATSNGVVNAVVVPAGATAVVLNVTAVNPTAGGYVSLRPGDATGAPTVSTLNVTAGGTFPNGATITIPTTGAHAGEIQVWYEAEYTTVGSTELLIDIAGYYELASSGPAGPKGDTGAPGSDGALAGLTCLEQQFIAQFNDTWKCAELGTPFNGVLSGSTSNDNCCILNNWSSHGSYYGLDGGYPCNEFFCDLKVLGVTDHTSCTVSGAVGTQLIITGGPGVVISTNFVSINFLSALNVPLFIFPVGTSVSIQVSCGQGIVEASNTPT